jgi:hypothetical protein
MQALMPIRQFDRPDYLSVPIDCACATQRPVLFDGRAAAVRRAGADPPRQADVGAGVSRLLPAYCLIRRLFATRLTGDRMIGAFCPHRRAG